MYNKKTKKNKVWQTPPIKERGLVFNENGSVKLNRDFSLVSSNGCTQGDK